MDLLTSLFVGRPYTIAAVGLLFLAGYFTLRFTDFGKDRHPKFLALAGAAWGIYAAWEALVLTQSPEAYIRVDLLLIWPVLAVLTTWSLFRSLR